MQRCGACAAWQRALLQHSHWLRAEASPPHARFVDQAFICRQCASQYQQFLRPLCDVSSCMLAQAVECWLLPGIQSLTQLFHCGRQLAARRILFGTEPALQRFAWYTCCQDCMSLYIMNNTMHACATPANIYARKILFARRYCRGAFLLVSQRDGGA